MLAAALLNYADDEGYFNANPGLIKADCFPLREPSVSLHDMLTMLSEIGYIELGNCPAAKRYGRIVNFLDHQRINRPTKSKIKELEIAWERSMRSHTQISDASPPERNREGKGKEQDSIDHSANDRDLNEEFEQWWQHVPRKVAKGQAKRKFKAARKKASLEVLTDGIKRYVEACIGKDPKYIAHPATWLHGERWLDDYGPPNGGGEPMTEAEIEAHWRFRLQYLIEEGVWSDGTPEPGQPGCKVPARLLEEFADRLQRRGVSVSPKKGAVA